MVTIPSWTFTGGETTIIQGLEKPDTELAQWYARVIEFILKVAEAPDFEIKDNGFRRFPGVLVTDGVKGCFRGESFQVWSDVPGEVILRHGSMRFQLASELIRRLEVLW